MVLIKEIELALTQENRTVPEAIEDTLIKDSVLELANTDFKINDFEETTLGDIRRKINVDLGSKYVGKPISRKRFAEKSLKGDLDAKKKLAGKRSKPSSGHSEPLLGTSSNEDNLETTSNEIHETYQSEDSSNDSDELSENNISGSGDDQKSDDEDSLLDDIPDREIDLNSSSQKSHVDSNFSDDEIDDKAYDSGADNDQDLADFQKTDLQGDSINIFSTKTKDVDAEVAKGKSVRNQLGLWEKLLECRIKFQPCLVATNKLFQKEDFMNFKSQLTPIEEGVLTKAYTSLRNLMMNLMELQEELLKFSPEYMKLRNDQNCSGTVENANHNNDDESIASSELSGDEEIFKEKPIQHSHQDIPGEPKKKKRKLRNYSDLLGDIYSDFKPFKDATIQKWNDKTRLATGKINSSDFSAFEQSTLKQIEQILMDKDRLIKKTQLKRTDYKILGENDEEMEAYDGPEKVNTKERIQNEYNVEIFDDDDFYHKLLRDFIEKKSSDVGDPSKFGRQWMELQQMRSKMKRKVDTKATKGRKLRYTVHNKLVNFMAPIPCNKWTPEAETQLFNSLFGKASVTT